MEKITKILAPTDLSELSRVGVRYALNLAKELGAEVEIYHVVNRHELLQYGDEIRALGPGGYAHLSGELLLEKYQSALSTFLKRHFADVTPGTKIREKVELGAADKNIVEEARIEAADLIVMSTHGRTGLLHVLVGSVTEKVVRHAPCPVLSIRPRLEEEPAEKRAAVA